MPDPQPAGATQPLLAQQNTPVANNQPPQAIQAYLEVPRALERKQYHSHAQISHILSVLSFQRACKFKRAPRQRGAIGPGSPCLTLPTTPSSAASCTSWTCATPRASRWPSPRRRRRWRPCACAAAWPPGCSCLLMRLRRQREGGGARGVRERRTVRARRAGRRVQEGADLARDRALRQDHGAAHGVRAVRQQGGLRGAGGHVATVPDSALWIAYKRHPATQLGEAMTPHAGNMLTATIWPQPVAHVAITSPSMVVTRTACPAR